MTDDPLDPSGIAQFVKHDRCPRYLKQRVDPGEEADARDWREAFGLMNIALLGHGRAFEATQVEALADDARNVIAPALDDTTSDGVPELAVDDTWADSPRDRTAQLHAAVEEAATLPTTTDDTPYLLCFQAPLGGQLGDEAIWGEADCLALAPAGAIDTDNHPAAQPIEDDADVVARVLDIKSASEEQPAHRVQVAIYSALLEQTLAEGPSPTCHIETSVLTRATAATPGESRHPLSLPTFRREEWELYADRLLASDGPVAEALTGDLADLPFSLDQVCDNCAYSEACTTRAVEAPTEPASLAVLGLDATVQERLRQAGITSLRDLSRVHPRLENPRPTDEPPTLELDAETRRRLEDALPGPIHETVQRAQALRGELDPGYPTTRRPQPLPGNDWIPLPDDRRDGWSNIDDAGAGELVHVALFVRPDATIDRIAALGACIHADAHEEYVTVGEVIDAVPDDPAVADRVEGELFERFLAHLFDAIEHVATAVGDPTEAGLHCYTYSSHEKRALAEGLDRHADHCQRARALRNLLSLHADGHTDVDQDMCSAVQPILHEHFALQYPAQGLLTVTEQFVPNWTIEALDPLDARPDEPPLRVIFREQFLNHRVPYLGAAPGIRLHLARGPLGEGPAAEAADTDADDPAPDGWYPLRRRAGGQFPIEYIWACTPRRPDEDTPRLTPDLVDQWAVDDDTEPLYRQELTRFATRTPGGDAPLQQADVAYLVERLSYALCRLVTAIPYKDLYHSKTPIDTTQLESFELPVSDLPAAARDYLRMEHGTRRDETRSRYRQSLRDRARTGRSVPFRCTGYDVDADGLLTITGVLAYDELFADDATARAVASQCRVRTSAGPGGGSWRVLTRLIAGETGAGAAASAHRTPTVDDPTTIEHSPPVLIEELDLQAGTITVTGFPHRFRQHGSEFRVAHCGWACPDGSNVDDPTAPPAARAGYVAGRSPVRVDTGEVFMLDPMVDDLGAPKADRALEPGTVSTNALWQHLQAAGDGRTRPRPAHRTGIDAFLETLASHEALLCPNVAQRRFVRAVDSPIVALQGPPGTGKTSGATAPALLARANARAQQAQSFVGLVVAPSHEAVDATLAGVVDLLADWRAVTGGLEALALVRVVPSPPPASGDRVGATTPAVTVQYCNYHSDDGEQRLRSLATDLFAPTDEPAGGASQCLLFATPATLYRTLGIVAEACSRIEGTSAPAAMRYEPGLADVVCVDEASMCDLPRLLLAGSVLKPGGQTLLVGDQRQLPTVTQHDWTATFRQPLEATQAYRSALAYLDSLHGADHDPLSAGAVQSGRGSTQARLTQFGSARADEPRDGGDPR